MSGEARVAHGGGSGSAVMQARGARVRRGPAWASRDPRVTDFGPRAPSGRSGGSGFATHPASGPVGPNGG